MQCMPQPRTHKTIHHPCSHLPAGTKDGRRRTKGCGATNAKQNAVPPWKGHGPTAARTLAATAFGSARAALGRRRHPGVPLPPRPALGMLPPPLWPRAEAGAPVGVRAASKGQNNQRSRCLPAACVRHCQSPGAEGQAPGNAAIAQTRAPPTQAARRQGHPAPPSPLAALPPQAHTPPAAASPAHAAGAGEQLPR
jgi:hypothetical protein